MAKAKDTYGKILKSTGIFGGSQVFNILIGVLRTKVVSVLLGPNGLGLMSLYPSVVDMLRSVSDLGLSFSAVRDISSAHATNDR
ncbi:MAG: oligosaccharide flippase family protein, partial [Bacteroidales bacterium]|nr:oligosaccharide flippase family protein [Bacteroidales bacterium]